MKSCAIYDEGLDRIDPIGYLFYYEKSESFIIELCEDLDELKDVYTLINEAIVEEPPISVKEGGLIKIGYNEEIDEFHKNSLKLSIIIIRFEESFSQER